MLSSLLLAPLAAALALLASRELRRARPAREARLVAEAVALIALGGLALAAALDGNGPALLAAACACGGLLAPGLRRVGARPIAFASPARAVTARIAARRRAA
jgi:hypothetical protein